MIVAFDLEGTLVDGELFPKLGAVLGNKPALDDITNKAMGGDLEFRTALQMRLNIINGVSTEKVREVAMSLPISKGAKETVLKVKKLDMVPIIISGGFDILAYPVANLLGIDFVSCNSFLINNGRISGVQEPIITSEAKAEKLIGLATWLGVDPRECVAVGDGANDIPMMQASGLSIAYNGREKVREIAKVAVNGKDLRLIIPYLEKYKVQLNSKRVMII